MADVLTGEPGIDDLIRQIIGEDDEDDDAGGDWAGVTALDSLSPTRIDAVDTPATGDPWLVLKSAGRGSARAGARAAGLVVKQDGERRYSLVRVYGADRPDRGIAMDGAQDFAPAAALQDAAWSFLQKGARVGTDHRDGTEGSGTVVESYLWPGDDWTLTAANGQTVTVRKGDWMAGIVWSPATWRAIRSGAYQGVSMQGSATRRKPTAAELAGLHKSAARRPRCGKCSKRAKSANDKFCWKCGARFGGGEAAKSAGGAQRAALAKAVTGEAARAADRLAWDVGRVRSGGPGERDAAFTRLAGEFGTVTAAALLSGEVTVAGLGARVAKAAVAAGMSRCRTCKGSGRLRHPSTGKPSRKCPSCRGSGQWSPGGDEADMTSEDAGLFEDAARKARSGGTGAPDGLGQLIALVGPDVAMKVMSGGEISPGEFRRGYISACRAHQAAAPGQEPRIPQSTHVAEASDFQRPPLTIRQSRPAPASAWPGSGGQWDSYAPGPGIGRDPASASYPLPGLASSARG